MKVPMKVAQRIVLLYDRKSALGAFPQPVGRLHSAAVLLEEDAKAFFRRYGEPQNVTGDETREALVESVQAMVDEAEVRRAQG